MRIAVEGRSELKIFKAQLLRLCTALKWLSQMISQPNRSRDILNSPQFYSLSHASFYPFSCIKGGSLPIFGIHSTILPRAE